MYHSDLELVKHIYDECEPSPNIHPAFHSRISLTTLS